VPYCQYVLHHSWHHSHIHSTSGITDTVHSHHEETTLGADEGGPDLRKSDDSCSVLTLPVWDVGVVLKESNWRAKIIKSGPADQKPDQSPNEIKSFISHSQHQPKTRRDLRGTARVGPFNVSTQLCGCNAQSKLPIALQTTPILSHILRASNHSHSLAHSSALPLFQSQHKDQSSPSPGGRTFALSFGHLSSHLITHRISALLPLTDSHALHHALTLSKLPHG
jgi:hypothetical protein